MAKRIDLIALVPIASTDDLQLLLLLGEVMNNERKRSRDLQMVRSSGREGFLHSRRSFHHFLGDGNFTFAEMSTCCLMPLHIDGMHGAYLLEAAAPRSYSKRW